MEKLALALDEGMGIQLKAKSHKMRVDILEKQIPYQRLFHAW
jgi:hypothetical protein